MSVVQGAPSRVTHEVVGGKDPVASWLTLAIVSVVILLLLGVLYALLAGYFGSATPRTLVESQLTTLQDSAKAYPGSGPARQAYILALEAAGQSDAAMKEYKKALSETKGIDKTAVYAAGITLLFDKKDYKGTIALAKTAIADDDAARKAVIADMLKKDAIVTDAQFDQKHRITILLTSARASGALGDWKAAEEQLTRALELDPQASDLYVIRASAYEQLEQRDKAIADYKAALAYIPDYQPALDGLKRLETK